MLPLIRSNAGQATNISYEYLSNGFKKHDLGRLAFSKLRTCHTRRAPGHTHHIEAFLANFLLSITLSYLTFISRN